MSPLHIACSRGDYRLVKVLLEALAILLKQGLRQDINFLDKLGRTPLFNACYHGRVEVVRLLLEFNKKFPDSVDFNCQVEGTGRTALHGAVARESREIVEMLLQDGHVTIGIEANPSSRTRQYLRKELERKRSQTHLLSPIHAPKLNECSSVSWDSAYPLSSSFSPPPMLGTPTSQSSQISDDIDAEIGVFGSPIHSPSPSSSNSTSPEQTRSIASNSPSLTKSTERSRIPPRSLPRSATLADPLGRATAYGRNMSSPTMTFDVFQNPKGHLEVLETSPGGHKRFGDTLITPLAEACVFKNSSIVELLLSYGAEDRRGMACQIAFLLKRESIMHMILAHECHALPDSEPDGMIQDSPGFWLSWDKKCLQKLNGAWLDETSPFYLRPVSSDDEGHLCRPLGWQKITYQMITQVQLSGNLLSSVPLELFRLPGVVKIDLSNNALTEIPEHPETQLGWGCGRLESLNISGNLLSVLPTSIWYLQSLRKLRAESNMLKRLYSGNVMSPIDSCCPSLEELHLQYNQLKSLPEFIFELPNLLKASFSHNELVTVPEHIWFNVALEEVDLSHNQLTSLPCCEQNELRDMSSFTSMTTSNVFSMATPAVGNQVMIQPIMVRQRSLYSTRHDSIHSTRRDGFKIRQVEEHLEPGDTIDLEFCDYSSLAKLNLSHNQLSFFPTALPCLTPNLSDLDISHNPVKTVDIQFVPQGLKKLMAKNCQIRQFGPTLTLQQSDVVKKRCYHDPQAQACLHRCHDSLQFLSTIHLNDNKLTNFLLLKHPPPKLHDLNGGIGEDERVFCQSNSTFDLLYPTLEGLDLTGNRLEGCFNPNIGRQNQLKWIRLGNNPSLERLPKEFAHLKKSNLLTLLEISNGLPKLVQPPPEYQTKETTVNQLLTYLKSLLKK